MSIREFRKLFDLPSVKLSRKDLESLGRLITEGLAIKPTAFDFSVSYGDSVYNANSLDELLSQDLPSSIANLSFRVYGWTNDNGIDRGISIDLHRTYASCQIHAFDEVWFKGKIQQITEFFQRRSPWYGKIIAYLPEISGLTIGGSFIALSFFLMKGQFVLAVLAGLTLLAVFKGASAHIKGNLFPFVDIRLNENASWLNREMLMVIFTAIGALATLAGVIVVIFK